MENTLKWWGTHTASDRHNLVVLARHLGVPEEGAAAARGWPQL